MEKSIFKARAISKNVLKGRNRSAQSDSKKNGQAQSQAQRLQLAPFKLSTDERGRERSLTRKSTAQEDKSKAFKAKPMPTYRFFEAAKTSANQDKAGQQTQFEEFNLSTRERS